MSEVKIRITGDICLTEEYNLNNISDEIKNIFNDNSYNVINLECPITSDDNKNRISKTGPHLLGNFESTKNVLGLLKIDLCTLSNNHIKDYGKVGIVDTIKFCHTNFIETVGAGININEASKPRRINFDSKVVSIINVAENEWSSANINSSGSSPFDVINTYNLIKSEKKEVDIIILIYHGGNEYYNLPNPKMRKELRFLIDSGADFIACHHTHCISGYEIYNNKKIYYGLGNFLFSLPSHKEDWYNGIVLDLKINSLGDIIVDERFTVFEKKTYALRLATKSEEISLKNRFKKYSNIISDDNKFYKSWMSFVDFRTSSNLMNWAPYNHLKFNIIKKILFKLGFFFLNKETVKIYLNLIRCESHFYLTKSIFKRFIK